MYFGAVDKLAEYFGEQGCPFPSDVNPAEFMIDVVSGSRSRDRDWAEIWLSSPQYAERMETLETLNNEAKDKPVHFEEDEYAATFGEQVRLVCERASVQVSLRTEAVPRASQQMDNPLTLALARHRVCHEQDNATHKYVFCIGALLTTAVALLIGFR